MSVVAAPVLTIAGLSISAGAGDLVAVGEERITWGRASILENPTPATAVVMVRDTTAGATFARRTDLIGQPVLLAYKIGTGAAVTQFRGRITDVSVTRRDAGGFFVQLAASSSEVEWANYTAPAGTSWPAETMSQRWSRVMGLMPGQLTGNVFQATWDTFGVAGVGIGSLAEGMAVAPADVSGRSCLDLWRELSDSMHPTPMLYDPTNDSLRPAVRRRFVPDPTSTVTTSAGLVADPDSGGRYIVTAGSSTPGVAGHALDGGRLRYDGDLHQPIDGRITRVELSYYDSAAAYAQRTITVTTAAGALEATIGRRVLAVSTIHATTANAQALATLYADIVDREQSRPRLGALGYSTAREPLHNAEHAQLMLGALERPAPVFVRDAWPTQLGQRPLVGVIGGQIRYVRGDWECDLNTSPVVVDPAPYAWAPLPARYAVKAGTTVRARDLDPSVTFADLNFVDTGAGYTAATQPAYPGNPT